MILCNSVLAQLQGNSVAVLFSSSYALFYESKNAAIYEIIENLTMLADRNLSSIEVSYPVVVQSCVRCSWIDWGQSLAGWEWTWRPLEEALGKRS